MPTRIVHLSDLHFPARKPGQPAALVASVIAEKPDMVVISGDLTRSGRRTEFQEADAFVKALPCRTLVVPGNHDTPIPGLYERLFVPFQRFKHYFANLPLVLETDDVFVIGFNSAVGMQFGMNWSLGKISTSQAQAIAAELKTRRADRLGIVVCHHPMRPHAMDVRRSTTRGGPAAFRCLAGAGMDLLLHGHLHRESCTCTSEEAGAVCELCANTALSDRERGGPAGYNVIEVLNREWSLTSIAYINGAYVARPPRNRCGAQRVATS